MTLTAPSVAELVAFTGVEEDDLGDYAERALTDAVLLFRLATGLTEWPTDEFALALAKNGVLSMAEALYYAQPFRAVLAKPFQSESIGSYSYSKAAAAVAGKLPTEVGWFDLAVQLITAAGDVAVTTELSTSISVLEGDGVVTVATTAGEGKAVLSPASPLWSYFYGADSAWRQQSLARGGPRG